VTRSRPLLPILVAIPLLAGGAILGVLLVGWINAASVAEEERARATLIVGASRVRGEAEDQVRVVLSLLRAAATADGGQDWPALAEAMTFWYESAPFAHVLQAVYVTPMRQAHTGWTYDRLTHAFTTGPLPADVVAALGQVPPAILAPLELTGGRALRIVPIAQTEAALLVVLDTGVIYREMIPVLMKDHLPDHPFRVVRGDSTLYESSPQVRDRRPETVVGLDMLLVYETHLPEDRALGRGDDRGGRPFLEDPSLRFWMLRLLRGRVERVDLPPLGPEMIAATRTNLEVYNPNRSLQSVILGRRLLSMGVGVGILAILTASAAVLFGLYRRSARLRASEQEFVASLSHELRTPISVIQATSENLANALVTDPGRLERYGRVIHEQVKRLSDMVEGILFYSGLQGDLGRTPNLAEVEPARLVEQVTAPLAELAGRRGSTLRLRAEGLPGRLCTDAVALRLILENLLTNAIRHADPGEIRMEISRRPYDLLRITVEDDGPGIPAREHRRVFEAFVRGERSARDQRPGSGLGLHLVRRVATMLDGTVALESPYPTLAGPARAGCRFTVTLPCREGC
jgi:signal transduction histidine kinase